MKKITQKNVDIFPKSQNIFWEIIENRTSLVKGSVPLLEEQLRAITINHNAVFKKRKSVRLSVEKRFDDIIISSPVKNKDEENSNFILTKDSLIIEFKHNNANTFIKDSIYNLLKKKTSKNIQIYGDILFADFKKIGFFENTQTSEGFYEYAMILFSKDDQLFEKYLETKDYFKCPGFSRDYTSITEIIENYSSEEFLDDFILEFNNLSEGD